MRAVVVTGTDTGVGKTVVTAALARGYADRGLRVAVLKPTQTGVLPGEAGDVDVIARLSGVRDVVEHVRLPEPLAPDTAGRRAGTAMPTVQAHADRIAGLDTEVALVEGAGGLLVRLDDRSGTIADLALALCRADVPVAVVVVARAGLGTLNHAALTVEVLRRRGLEPAGLVIGCWPADPDLAERCNVDDLPAVTGLPLLGRIPAGAGQLTPDAFASAAPTWIPVLP
ncbi:MAG: ATP-dependent dethiobiotin synthetase BioD [Propionibacteriales bacterium]|nr:ATP-dependent dethiobiotin synthetase BioD [Propionibacteriales bacterium]